MGWPITVFELEGSVEGVNSNRRLGNPCESFRKASIKSFKEDATEPESVSNSTISSKIGFDSVVPSSNTWMDFKPSSVESLRFFNCPATLDSRCAWATTVVNSVDSVLAFLALLSSSIAVLLEFGEFVSPHCFGVVDVDIHICPEGGFEIVVLSFPGDDLGIGALQIGLEHDEAGVGAEEFTDVGK